MSVKANSGTVAYSIHRVRRTDSWDPNILA